MSVDWTRYSGVSLHLDLNGNEKTPSQDEKKKAEPVPKPAPTIDGAIIEDPSETEGRFWRWCLKTSRPLSSPEDPDSPDAGSPPWGPLDIEAVIKKRVPISMVGAGLMYFNAARYSNAKFSGFLSMMEVKNIPKGEYVVFSKASENPLEDGFLTQFRFVSKTAYTKYFHVNMAMDKNPLKKMGKKPLFEMLQASIVGQMKLYGKGKKVKPPKNPNAEEGEEEEEEEEDDDGGDFDFVAAQEHLNTVMQINGRGRNIGEWALGFGFVTESEHYGVYRLWSRAIFHPGSPIKAPTAE